MVVDGPSGGVLDALACFPLPHDLTEGERPPSSANQPDEVQSHVRDGEHQDEDQTAGHISSTQRGPKRMLDADRPRDLVSAHFELLGSRVCPVTVAIDGARLQTTINEHSVHNAQPSLIVALTLVPRRTQRRRAAHASGPNGSSTCPLDVEVAATGEPLVGLRPSELIKSDPLDPGVCDLNAGPMRDLEPHAESDAAISQICDRPVQICHPVDQHRLLSFKMLRQQERWRMRREPDHRHASPEGLDRKDQIRSQARGEVRYVACDVTAWQVDEVQPIEHPQEPTLGPAQRPCAGRPV